MSASFEVGAVPPQARRRMLVAGLLLGAACLALTVAFIIIFRIYGFPKDPKEFRRLQQREAAAGGGLPVPNSPADTHHGEPSPDQH